MIDIHCHLSDFDQIPDPTIKLITCATNTDNYEKNLNFSLQNQNIKCAIGTHPWFTEKYDEVLLKNLLLNNPLIGVGEIGLDGCKKTPNQFEIFKSQFMLATNLNRTVIIHCVKKFNELCPFFKSLKQRPKQILLHSFSGTKNDVLFFNQFDCFYSFTDKNFKAELLSYIPSNKILIETDSPSKSYQSPQNLPLILDKITSISKIEKNVLIHNSQVFYDNF